VVCDSAMQTPDTGFRLVAIDLDGTLLDDDLRIHPRTEQALRAAADRGVTIAIATGRMHSSAAVYAERLGIGAPIISYNGAMIRRAGDPQPLWHQPIPADLAAEAVELCVHERWDLMYFLDDDLYVPRYDRWAHEYLARTGNDAIPFGDLRRMAGNQPTKLLVPGTPDQVLERYDFFAEHYAGRLHCTISLPEYLELLHPEVSKASALRRLAAMLGVGMESVMAIGDSLNDLEMIETAGLGVMMASAGVELRAAADFVPESAEAGVAEAIERLVLEPAGARPA